MIDEKKLIEELESMPYIHGRYDHENGSEDFTAGIEMYHEMVISKINEQPKIGNWIPVEERLPEDDKYILLSFENFSIPLVGRYDRDETGAAFYVGDDTESCSSSGVFVNAWMSLPEPYRGEK